MTFSRARLLRALRHAICFGSIFLLAAVQVYAQESAPSPADSPTGWVFRWLNFAIVALAIIWGFSKAGPYFRRHADEISEQIAEGTRAREAAEQKRREVQAKLAGIETEVAAIRAEAKQSTQAEAERLKTLAKAEVDAIERSAQAEIAAAERAARLELKAFAARVAVERAEAVLRRELTPQAESALFRAFVVQLERSAN